ncbi:MAG: O-antigen ligase family protein [Desulfoplanes sp.]
MYENRLTGSFSTYRVGNLMAMILPPAMGIYFLWNRSWSAPKKRLLTALILIPALFLFAAAKARSGYVGYFMACIAMLLFFRGFSWPKTIFVLALVCGALFFGPSRTSYTRAIGDPRIQYIWPTAIQVFEHNPILGVGVNGFTKGFKSLGLHMPGGLDIIPHPHNVYLQLASETGIVGLGLFLFWIGSYLLWSWKKIRTGWLESSDTTHWALAFCFWSAFLGYTGIAISGHNFFRTWWLGMALTLLGITIGACLAQPDSSQPSKK